MSIQGERQIAGKPLLAGFGMEIDGIDVSRAGRNELAERSESDG